jgi:hypothetical protein
MRKVFEKMINTSSMISMNTESFGKLWSLMYMGFRY